MKLSLSSSIWKAIGPGILVACAAVGGSHLVWSTQAGAYYGWSLMGLVLLANLLKFPFFLYGQRYTATTGESLLAGYLRQGKAYVWIFLLINILTGIFNIAGVGMLSGALLRGYGIQLEVAPLTVALLAFCAVLLLAGSYSLLDRLSKIIIVVLSFATLAAVVFAVGKSPEVPAGFTGRDLYTASSFVFIVNLLGWMPAPIDLSAWSSLWMFSRKKQTGHMATVRESSIDFYLGYGSATVLALLFVALGALVMYGTGEEFSTSGIGFSAQLVSLYTATIGEWSRGLILTAAFITMFSTTLTCLDGYPRSLAACCSLLGAGKEEKFDRLHRFWILLSGVAASLIVLLLVKNLLQMLAFAAVISFLTSPVLAYINLRVMRSAHVPTDQRPTGALLWLSWAGIAFFVLMSLGYVYARFQ
jgi:Mn2+/Fe2+ NRAMP family transporter